MTELYEKIVQLPAPLVPAEVDLRDFDYMPLHGARLMGSDTWAICDADEKVAALTLWWSSWHEEPAGSLTDNDRVLAKAAGYGVAVREFLRVKDNAMRGWIKCSDGRLYHPVVASLALEVWATRRRKKAENAADRERKRIKKLAHSGGKHENSGGVPAEQPQENTKIPAENALKRRDREEIRKNPPYSPPEGGESDLLGEMPVDGGSTKAAETRTLKADFEAWWVQYPRKVGKAAAERAYRAARLRPPAPPAGDLLAGVMRYAQQRAGEDPKFTAHPATWLNAGRWEDQPENGGPHGQAASRQQRGEYVSPATAAAREFLGGLDRDVER